MHELAVCQALLEQVEAVASGRGARSVARVVVRIGPLSGVEPPLLQNAFRLARAGTLADAAELDIESMPVRLACRVCGTESEVAANRLVCSDCGSLRTRLLSGDELQLARLDLDLADTAATENGEANHV